MKSKSQKKEFVELIEQGSSITKACKLINIHRSTFYEWLSSDMDFNFDYMRAKMFCRETTDDIASFLYHQRVREGDKKFLIKWLDQQHSEYARKPLNIVLKLKETDEEGLVKSMDHKELFELTRALDNFGFKAVESIPKELQDAYWIWYAQNYPGGAENLKHNPRSDFINEVFNRAVENDRLKKD